MCGSSLERFQQVKYKSHKKTLVNLLRRDGSDAHGETDFLC